MPIRVGGPFLGDGHGRFRIQIVGNSGSGKSTVGHWLAARLNIPFIPLDEVFWRPGWKETPKEEFRAKVTDIMQKHQDGWIIDGEYPGTLQGLVSGAATDIIWLDPPLALYFPRVVFRTILGLLSLAPPCSPGCREVWPKCVTRKGILWWCLTNHSVVRKRYTERAREWGVENGGKLRRLGGWGSELRAWQREVTVAVSCN
ncbi:hypothetical protein FIBSPDRAFT_844190 [Athelia psychrophila]|uniref:Adenylate kinase n=1 Tax=Athelia psychrophila TaxID=1759441 RepID=A0A167USE8_9AGAM|nr:hypothetical protein FIBSPDRAFT_844190 [Fibularhizoctonia sp. CBS 109695]